MKCPTCSSGNIVSRRDGMLRCKLCGLAFPPHEAKEGRQERLTRSHGGSGVIAGKVEIGRGFNWKAGL